LNASNGEEVNTPPKSQITASTATLVSSTRVPSRDV
jgi:hypothetical protein